MSTLSQFAGGAGIPIGGVLPYLPAGAGVASQLVMGGQEYLRAGLPLVPYSANYAAAVAVNPLIARFGRLLDLGLGSNGTTPTYRLIWDGTRYQLFELQFSAGELQTVRNSTNLSTWSAAQNVLALGSDNYVHGSIVGYGGGWAGVFQDGLRWRLVTGTDGGGSQRTALSASTSFSPQPSNIEFDGTTGAVLFTDGTTQVARRVAASPDGVWTASARTGATVNSDSSLAGSGTAWVAIARQSAVTIRSSTDAINWTARTLTVPANLSLSSPRGTNLVWTGSTFLAAFMDSATSQIWTARSTDGVTWTLDAPVPGLIGGVGAGSTDMCICTDRAGRVALAVGFDNQTSSIAYSTDSGLNWSMARLPGVVTLRGVTIPNNPVPCGQMNFANGELILNRVNFTGSGFGRPTLVGATVSQLASPTPQFVGTPDAITFASGIPAYFRIR